MAFMPVFGPGAGAYINNGTFQLPVFQLESDTNLSDFFTSEPWTDFKTVYEGEQKEAMEANCSSVVITLKNSILEVTLWPKLELLCGPRRSKSGYFQLHRVPGFLHSQQGKTA